MRQVARQAPSHNQLLFLPGVFNETLGLLFDAHHYFENRAVEEQAVVSASLREMYAFEMSRVSARLTSVMAWLLIHRAMHETGASAESEPEAYHLDGAEICLDHCPEALAQLPYYLMYLSERSLALYERIYRLDSMEKAAKH